MPISREERRRKNHESLLNLLFPPPPSPPPQQQDEEQSSTRFLEDFNGDDTPPDESGSSSSSDDDGNEKLTRAQRKRLRKRKLKQTALQRRKLIGPLLPSSSIEGFGSGFVENGPSSVRHNATEGPDTRTEDSGCVASNKLQHRRKAKRQAKVEKLNSLTRDKSDRECPSSDRSGNAD